MCHLQRYGLMIGHDVKNKTSLFSAFFDHAEAICKINIYKYMCKKISDIMINSMKTKGRVLG